MPHDSGSLPLTYQPPLVRKTRTLEELDVEVAVLKERLNLLTEMFVQLRAANANDPDRPDDAETDSVVSGTTGTSSLFNPPISELPQMLPPASSSVPSNRRRRRIKSTEPYQMALESLREWVRDMVIARRRVWKEMSQDSESSSHQERPYPQECL